MIIRCSFLHIQIKSNVANRHEKYEYIRIYFHFIGVLLKTIFVEVCRLFPLKTILQNQPTNTKESLHKRKSYRYTLKISNKSNKIILNSKLNHSTLLKRTPSLPLLLWRKVLQQLRRILIESFTGQA